VDHTPHGVPYVEPADVLIDYPAASLELAQVLDPVLALAVPWTDLPLLSGWVPLGSGYAPPAYCIDPLGRIALRGTISYPAPQAPTNIQIAVLPIPATGTLLWMQGCIGDGMCRVDLASNGALNCVGPIPGPNAWLSLTGITYDPSATATELPAELG
jgi:hypothetical protein